MRLFGLSNNTTNAHSVRSATITLADGSSFTLSNVSVTLNGKAVRRILSNSKVTFIPDDLKALPGLESKEREFIAKSQDKAAATYAANLFHAFVNGHLEYLQGVSGDPLPRPKLEDFEDFVDGVVQMTPQVNIAHHLEQLAVFYAACPPESGEFMVSYADRLIITNKRLVALTEGPTPAIMGQWPLSDIREYRASDD